MSDVRQDYRDYLWAPFTQMEDLAEEEPVVVVGGDGAMVVDSLGREYIDGHGALWLSNVGVGRKEITAAVSEQMERLSWFPSFGGLSNDVAIALAKRLVHMTQQEHMARVFFSSGGSEANDTAFKMARQYWKLKGQAGKYKFIARKRAYHGVTFGALSATGLVGNRRLFEPLVPGFRHIEPPYCYRCSFGLQPDNCRLACARELEQTIQFEGADTVAAFIAEPIIGAGGVIVPPDGYWEEVSRICREHDVLLISDEVITGFGRTGKLFGGRHWDLKPDIMVFAKALTSGYLPLGATLARSEIYEVCMGRWGEGREFRHGTTYSGHPAACAAAMANLDILERENLVERAAESGDYLLARLRELQELPVVGNVDGRGLLARLEIVRDQDAREAFPAGDLVGLKVSRQLLKRGVILRPLGDVISFSPPLVIEKQQVDTVVDRLAEILEALPR